MTEVLLAFAALAVVSHLARVQLAGAEPELRALESAIRDFVEALRRELLE